MRCDSFPNLTERRLKKLQVLDKNFNKELIRIPKIHRLKIKYDYYRRLLSGNKKLEIRYNDRDYQVGDILYFERLYYHADNYIEPSYNHYQKVTIFVITDVLDDFPGLTDGYVALSILQCSVGLNDYVKGSAINFVNNKIIDELNVNILFIQNFLETLDWKDNKNEV